MKIPWLTERCIICLREPDAADPLSQLTDAHVIPESVGGKLSAEFLCDRCNSEMGRVEGQLPRDITIIELVRQLEGELPAQLAKGILQHAAWFADTDDYGRLQGSDDHTGDFSLRESENIRTDENMRKQLRAELARRGVPPEEVEEKAAEFEAAPDGAELEPAPGFTIVKHIDLSAVSFQRSYSEPLAPRAIALGIAYTFLALMLEDNIYRDELEPVCEVLRRVVARDTAAADSWPIDCLQAPDTPPEPRHALAVKMEEGGLFVRIWLFRGRVWDVHFPGIGVRKEPFYLLDLTTGEETVEF